jgi:hypothetical protein
MCEEGHQLISPRLVIDTGLVANVSKMASRRGVLLDCRGILPDLAEMMDS